MTCRKHIFSRKECIYVFNLPENYLSVHAGTHNMLFGGKKLTRSIQFKLYWAGKMGSANFWGAKWVLVWTAIFINPQRICLAITSTTGITPKVPNGQDMRESRRLGSFNGLSILRSAPYFGNRDTQVVTPVEVRTTAKEQIKSVSSEQ
jgi:hypothetical protein